LVVPKNLYIIGTMNTADRSAGRIDYAIRRRFDFYAIHANPDAVNSDIGKKLMEEVNKFVEKYVSPDYDPEDIKVGHTYFISSFTYFISSFNTNKTIWKFVSSNINKSICLSCGIFAGNSSDYVKCNEGDYAILYTFEEPKKVYGLWEIIEVPKDENGEFKKNVYVEHWPDGKQYEYQVRVKRLVELEKDYEDLNSTLKERVSDRKNNNLTWNDITQIFDLTDDIILKFSPIIHNFLYQVVPLLYEYIVDGLLNVNKEETKGYPIELFGEKFYIKGGVLYNNEGKKVTQEDVANLILKKIKNNP
jgi:hypothetical protein